MIKITPEAAKQISASAKQGETQDLPLRIAVNKNDDNSLHYGMGFDDRELENDVTFSSEGVEIVVSPDSMELLHGTVLDYVELEPGQFHFIFQNPNDPDHASGASSS